jgi:hypothetical protein
MVTAPAVALYVGWEKWRSSATTVTADALSFVVADVVDVADVPDVVDVPDVPDVVDVADVADVDPLPQAARPTATNAPSASTTRRFFISLTPLLLGFTRI